jgi:hypothetical protein
MDAGVPSSAQPLLEGRPAVKGVVNNLSPCISPGLDEPRTGDLRVHLATPILQLPLRGLLDERSAGRVIGTWKATTAGNEVGNLQKKPTPLAPLCGLRSGALCASGAENGRRARMISRRPCAPRRRPT